METIEVKNCQDCPFVNYGGEDGYNACSIKKIKLTNWEELPEIGVHEKCPLKEKEFLVKREL